MSEQIVDLIEALPQPGPRGLQGERGPQGLPGVNAVPADEAVAAYIQDAASKTHAALHPARHMVVFGDSMTVSASATSRNWWAIVARELGLTAHNYGVGGTGWLNMQSSGGYPGQLDRAKADTGYDHDAVSLVFVNGSTNDWHTGDYGSRIDSWCRTVKSMYPNAAFIGFSGLCAANVRHRGNPARMPNYAPMFNECAKHLQLNGFHVFTNSHLWLLYNFDLSQDDTLHPNDRGHEAIAQLVLGGLRDGVWSPAPALMGAVERASELVGDDAGQLALPYKDSPAPEKDYLNWSVDPASGMVNVLFNFVKVKLEVDEIKRFSFTAIHDDQGGITEVYGLDLPLFVKPYPMQRDNTHERVETWIIHEWYVNNVLQPTPLKVFSRSSDDRLDNPSDAKYYLWAQFQNISFMNTNGNFSVYHPIAIGGPMRVAVCGRISMPICGYFNE